MFQIFDGSIRGSFKATIICEKFSKCYNCNKSVWLPSPKSQIYAINMLKIMFPALE